MSKKLLMNHASENGLLPVMDGLICWLDGRDGKETIWVDRSGNGNDATVTNCEWTGKALKTISISSEFLVNKRMISKDTDPYTIEVYFSRYASDRFGAIENVIMANSIKEWGSSTSIYITGHNMFYDRGNHSLDTYSPYNKPYHIVIAKNNVDRRKAFLNGEYSGESPWRTNGILFLGNFDDKARIKGNYYSIRVYNRALTEEEIQHNYLYEQSIERGE